MNEIRHAWAIRLCLSGHNSPVLAGVILFREVREYGLADCQDGMRVAIFRTRHAARAAQRNLRTIFGYEQSRVVKIAVSMQIILED